MAGPSRLFDLLADGDDPFKELTEEKVPEAPTAAANTHEEDFDEF